MHEQSTTVQHQARQRWTSWHSMSTSGTPRVQTAEVSPNTSARRVTLSMLLTCPREQMRHHQMTTNESRQEHHKHGEGTGQEVRSDSGGQVRSVTGYVKIGSRVRQSCKFISGAKHFKQRIMLAPPLGCGHAKAVWQSRCQNRDSSRGCRDVQKCENIPGT